MCIPVQQKEAVLCFRGPGDVRRGGLVSEDSERSVIALFHLLLCGEARALCISPGEPHEVTGPSPELLHVTL